MTWMALRLNILSALAWAPRSTRSTERRACPALRDTLARYVSAARRAGGGARSGRGGRRAARAGLKSTGAREWAKAQGIEVKDRGRVPAELVARFEAATGQ